MMIELIPIAILGAFIFAALSVLLAMPVIAFSHDILCVANAARRFLGGFIHKYGIAMIFSRHFIIQLTMCYDYFINEHNMNGQYLLYFDLPYGAIIENIYDTNGAPRERYANMVYYKRTKNDGCYKWFSSDELICYKKNMKFE